MLCVLPVPRVVLPPCALLLTLTPPPSVELAGPPSVDPLVDPKLEKPLDMPLLLVLRLVRWPNRRSTVDTIHAAYSRSPCTLVRPYVHSCGMKCYMVPQFLP